MRFATSKFPLERGAASDLWRNTLSQITTVFGRLVYLSSLRNANTGHYEHHGLELVFGEKEADKAMRRTHVQAFDEWLNYSLEQQKADLDSYLVAFGDKRAAVVDTWLRLTPYKAVVPTSCRNAERDLFFTEFSVLLELLKNEYGVDGPDPDA